VPEGEAFYTDTGREVFGGGGIAPDVLVDHEEISTFSQHLLAHNAFFDYAVDFHNRQPVKAADWRPADDVVERFSAWLVEHDVADTKQIAEGFADPATRELARLQIQAEVLNAAFGQEARHRALIQGDRQVAEALAQFERARGLLASRQAAAAAGELGRRPNRPAPEATAESGPEIPPVVRPGSDG
jgi:carboxyl-terminal processing protease